MDTPSTPAASAPKRLLNVRGRMYEPAIGPRLKILLFFVFAATAVLGVTGIYLLSIDLLERLRQRTYTNQFTLQMFVIHILVGLAFIVPFLIFGCTHLLTARKRKNRLAVKLGIALFSSGILVVVTGLALIQLSGFPQLPTGSIARWVVYVLHAALPVAAVVLYILHRRAGPDIQWKYGYAWGVGVAVFVASMIVLHLQDPRQWFAVGPREGEKYFEPSKARTDSGRFIPASALMKDEYCMQCHEDIYKQHLHSAHHFSSFNNPPYRFSVRESRKIVDERGIPRASRWCAGCHDLVPFFSGKFDDPNFDDENDPTVKAGITCVACHAITNVNSTEGNAAYTIEEPLPYPFAYSDNALLRWFSNQVLKAKPDFHKKTFLKSFHRNADINSEFCSTCHKVSLPVELNHYKEFLRGQNHYDPFLLSGVSGHGALSFYYPPKAKNSCNQCHMPLQPSNDFGSKDFDGSGVRKVHDHFFPGANTGLPYLLSLLPEYAGQADGLREAIRKNADFLRGTAGINPAARQPDASLRIDLFGLKEGGTIDGRFLGPLRPSLPKLKPGKSYLVEVVIRTIAMGHLFTQGTVDSNEVWVDFTARSNGKVIGRSGALAGPDESGPVDEWSHFLNVLMLDRHGKRVNRRNAQDIFTPLYNHQIPPGAGQVVHYELKVPQDVKGPVELEVRVRYRKFDFEYMSLVYGGADKAPKLPIVDLCSDRVTLPVEGVAAKAPEQTSPIQPAWQRWNDYGIGCLLEGFPDEKKGELRQAETSFQAMLTEHPDNKEAAGHAYLNLARVYEAQGVLSRAVAALEKAREAGAPWWTVAYFNGRVNLDNTTDRRSVDAAIANFKSILDPDKQPRERLFDFTKDYRVINELGRALFERASFERGKSAQRNAFLLQAIEQYERALKLDSENEKAHFGLHQCFQMLGRPMSSSKSPARVTTDEASLQTLAGTLLDDKAEKWMRRNAAGILARAVTALGSEPISATQPKRPRFELLLARIEPYFHRESDAELKEAAAFVLDRLHLELFKIFKPDELAQNRAIQLYRAEHPAADHAAEFIVIYSLYRR
ncbi:MAG TPA: multiheme c-type cytochrome [Gemmataceae bacterium]|nr:multiheme c-type cytochrome [Gemmataceae bacterium]